MHRRRPSAPLLRGRLRPLVVRVLSRVVPQRRQGMVHGGHREDLSTHPRLRVVIQLHRRVLHPPHQRHRRQPANRPLSGEKSRADDRAVGDRGKWRDFGGCDVSCA